MATQTSKFEQKRSYQPAQPLIIAPKCTSRKAISAAMKAINKVIASATLSIGAF
jgi:hypothetical protein